MWNKLRYGYSLLKQRLYFKPLAVSLGSLALLAIIWQVSQLHFSLPIKVKTGSVTTLLQVLASSMLAVTTFAVGSMVSAYASVSASATPRAVKLIISEDNSKNALSIFLGSFIYSVITLTAIENDLFNHTAISLIFIATLAVLAIILLTFVHWIDQIARLGRIGTTIESVEKKAAQSLAKHAKSPTLGAKLTLTEDVIPQNPIYATQVGYVQYVDMSQLQELAEKENINIHINVLPGKFITPNQVIAYIYYDEKFVSSIEPETIENAFSIAGERHYEDDPRFGLLMLSEIASKALSPAVNDPGTAIDIITRLVKLFYMWQQEKNDNAEVCFENLSITPISAQDMMQDAFFALARDGAGCAEVMVKLLKAYQGLENLDGEVAIVAKEYQEKAIQRARENLTAKEDLEMLDINR